MHAEAAHTGEIEALRLSQQRAQLAIDVARLGTWTWTPQEVAAGVELDARCREICGLPEAGVVSQADVLARVHPDDRDRIKAALVAAFDPAGDGLYSEEMRFLHADGSVRWAVARGRTRFDFMGAARQAIELFGSLVDVTAQVSFNDRYHALFKAIDRGFCVVQMLFDAAGNAVDYRFLETNPQFVVETGLVDAVGRRMRELAPTHEEHWFRIYGEVARTGVPARFENAAEALGRWYDVYAYRVGDPLAHQVGILFADISERKRIEQALHETDRRKDEFLATLAHELRNPLAPLRVALDVLQHSDDPVMAARLHRIMSRQVNQLTRLVDDLMEVSRITRGHIQLRIASVDLADIVRDGIETSRPLLDAQGQTLTVDLPESRLAVDVDAMRMTQVVTNLLNNASRYGRPGGQVQLRAWQDGAQVVLAVRDDGIGIPSDKLQAIFQTFTQLNRDVAGTQSGLGIGLSLVRSLVERHGGEVAASSAGEGNGSEFVVRLPVGAGQREAGAAGA